MSDLSKKLSSLNSASYYLTVGDLDKFQPGQPKSDILKDVQWRAGSVVAADCKGKRVTAITYDLLADGPESHREEFVHAVFVDDKFVKFIRWLPGEQIPKGQNRPKRTKIGDYCGWLIRAMDSECVSVEDLSST